jgi:HlyD family secretion protein
MLRVAQNTPASATTLRGGSEPEGGVVASRKMALSTALAVLAAAVAAFAALHPGAGAPLAFETEGVTRGPVAARVTATGTLSARVTVEVGSQVSGRIQALYADFNDRVATGQVIARIDPQLFESEVAQARANLAAAQAAVQRAEAERAEAQRRASRVERLAAQNLTPEAEADAARTALQSADAQVASAEAALAQASAALERAETQLAYSTIVSPIDGVVISRDVDVGQTVAASFQAPTLFTLAEDLRKMQVHTHVAEADVGLVAPGMRVEFSVDAYVTERFHGEVKEVRFAPQREQNVVTYDAVVDVENPDLKLRPGMTADVRFLVAEREDALLVPNVALRFAPPPEVAAAAGLAAAEGAARSGGAADRRLVWVLGEAARPEPREVRVGISDGRITEIVEGALEAGDRVIVAVAGGEGARRPERPRFGRFL